MPYNRAWREIQRTTHERKEGPLDMLHFEVGPGTVRFTNVLGTDREHNEAVAKIIGKLPLITKVEIKKEKDRLAYLLVEGKAEGIEKLITAAIFTINLPRTHFKPKP